MNWKLIKTIIKNLPKTLYVNFKVFDFKTACKLPFIISNKTKIEGINKNTIKINSSNIGMAMIMIGINNGSEGLMSNKSRNYFGTDGKSQIIFNGYADISKGCCLKAINNGVLTIGSQVSLNANCKIFCKKEITISDNALFGWNCTLNDGDGHIIYDDNKEVINQNKSVFVGKGAWLGAEVTLLKGSYIPDSCIVGYGSIVTKKFDKENCIIAGYPAKLIKENVNWE